jgi:protein-disulfide isomerase/uncharacterized membrane protein
MLTSVHCQLISSSQMTSASEPEKQTGSVAPRLWWPRFAFALLCVAGGAAAVELALIHARVYRDPNVQSFCALSEGVNCDTVALSPYSVFLNIPVAVWGILGYGLMALVLAWGWVSRERRIKLVVLGALAAASVCVSAVLAVISVLHIRSLCILCLATYIINVLLLAIVVLLWRRECSGLCLHAAARLLLQHRRVVARLGALAGGAVAMLWVGYPRYWIQAADASVPAAAASALPSASSCPEDTEVATGVTADGHHWIGARDPQVTVIEFSDYQCPFCSRAHWEMRTLMRAHFTAIRLVHRHFPLDEACNPIIQRPFHPRACFYAALAICAAEQDKFWAANDYLYVHGRDQTPVQPELLAQELGLELQQLRECLQQRAWEKLKGDLGEGIRLQLRGTPTFVIDGTPYMGKVPPEVLESYLPARPGRGSG